MDGFDHIILKERSGALEVTLNRPEVRNAMSLAMVRELRSALQSAEDNGLRAVLLRGAGGHFCSGGDLKDMAAARAADVADRDPVADVSREFGHLCAAFAKTDLVVVALLEGAVMGGGFGLACVADAALVLPSASFRLPETELGLVPAQIAPFLVERLGPSEAKRVALCGGTIDAMEAERIGLAHFFHDSLAAAETHITRILDRVCRAAPGATAATKRLVREARLRPASDLVDGAAAVFAEAVRGEEGREGLSAFVEKRVPNWVRSGP